MKKERILQKIKHCFALSKSANENEAAMALRQAHALMEKHNISLSDMSMADISCQHTKAAVAKKPPTHQAILINQIATMFGCQAIMRYIKGARVVEFIGYDAYPDIASYAFDVLNRQLKKARKDYIDTELKRVKIRANKTARADSYCYGWVISVVDKISDIVPPSVNTQLITQYVKEHVGEVKEKNPRDRSNALASRRSQHKDMNRGYQDGKKAQLHNAMHTAQTNRIGGTA